MRNAKIIFMLIVAIPLAVSVLAQEGPRKASRGGIIGKMKEVLQKVKDQPTTVRSIDSQAVFQAWTDGDRVSLKQWYPKATDEGLRRYEQAVKDFLRDPQKRKLLDAIDAGSIDAVDAAGLASEKITEAGREDSAQKALEVMKDVIDYAAGALDATDAASRLFRGENQAVRDERSKMETTLAESIGQAREELKDLMSNLTKAQYAAMGSQETLDFFRSRSEAAGALAEGGELAGTVLGKTTDLIGKVDRYAGIAESLLTNDPEKKILGLEDEAAHWLSKIGDSGKVAGPMSHLMKGTLETQRELGRKVNRDMGNLNRVVNADDEEARAAALRDLSSGSPDTNQYAKDFVKHIFEKTLDSLNPFADSGRSQPQQEEPGMLTKIWNGLFPGQSEPQSQMRESDRAYRQKMRDAFLKE